MSTEKLWENRGNKAFGEEWEELRSMGRMGEMNRRLGVEGLREPWVGDCEGDGFAFENHG